MNVVKLLPISLSLLMASALCAAPLPEVNSDEISTVGGLLKIEKFETDPSILKLGDSELPIASNYYLAIEAKVHFSENTDFVLFASNPGGNAMPTIYYVLRIDSDKNWRLADINCISFNGREGDGSRFFKDGDVVKVQFPRYDNYRVWNVTAVVNREGQFLKEDAVLNLASLIPPIGSFDDLLRPERPSAALIQLPSIKAALMQNGTFSYVRDYLENTNGPELTVSPDKNAVYVSADGSHAEAYQELDMWADRSGEFVILFPNAGAGETQTPEFCLFTNLPEKDLRSYLEQIIRERKYDWFTADVPQKSSFWINGIRKTASAVFVK